MSILKSIAKALCPSDETLAEAAAGRIQDGVNGVADERKAVVAKYATLAKEIGEVGTNLAAMLTDGNIDRMEAEQIAAYLKPLFAKGKELVFG